MLHVPALAGMAPACTFQQRHQPQQIITDLDSHIHSYGHIAPCFLLFD
jgi:hypothetical protein